VVHVVVPLGIIQAEEPSEGHTGAVEPGSETTAHTEAQPDNPVLPVVPELIWGGACFLLLWALMKFWLLKPIQRTMYERSEKVRRDLDVAEQLKDEAVAALAEHEASLAASRAEASHIIDAARAEADEERQRILAEAEAEVAQLRARANAEVEGAKAEALEGLRGTVATIAVQAAEIVVQKRLDEAAQRATIDEYVNRASQN
jgi:F-type H+-transporting ATPase subunit b